MSEEGTFQTFAFAVVPVRRLQCLIIVVVTFCDAFCVAVLVPFLLN